MTSASGSSSHRGPLRTSLEPLTLTLSAPRVTCCQHASVSVTELSKGPPTPPRPATIHRQSIDGPPNLPASSPSMLRRQSADSPSTTHRQLIDNSQTALRQSTDNPSTILRHPIANPSTTHRQPTYSPTAIRRQSIDSPPTKWTPRHHLWGRRCSRSYDLCHHCWPLPLDLLPSLLGSKLGHCPMTCGITLGSSVGSLPHHFCHSWWGRCGSHAITFGDDAVSRTSRPIQSLRPSVYIKSIHVFFR